MLSIADPEECIFHGLQGLNNINTNVDASISIVSVETSMS